MIWKHKLKFIWLFVLLLPSIETIPYRYLSLDSIKEYKICNYLGSWRSWASQKVSSTLRNASLATVKVLKSISALWLSVSCLLCSFVLFLYLPTFVGFIKPAPCEATVLYQISVSQTDSSPLPAAPFQDSALSICMIFQKHWGLYWLLEFACAIPLI